MKTTVTVIDVRGKMLCIKLTWTRPCSCLFAPSGPRSAAVEPAVSPPSGRSFQPAQKHRVEGAQYKNL